MLLTKPLSARAASSTTTPPARWKKKRQGYFNMSHQSDLISEDILAYLGQHERKELLRFLTCGNVDDGKAR